MEKASDDGEPDGTAGKPILDVIKKNNLQDVIIIVVRYFGGIKLGAGGLVRAYSTSAGDVVKGARIGYTKIMTEFQITTPIKNAKTLLEIFRKNSVNISNQMYADHFIVNVYAEDMVFLDNSGLDLDIQTIQKTKVFYDKN